MAQGKNLNLFTRIGAAVASALVASPGVSVTPYEAPNVEHIVKEAIASDPVIVNETNSEAPLQSRVTIGNVVAAIGLAASLTGHTIAPEDQLALVNIGTAAVTAWGIGYSLYGRWWPRLKPLFSRK